MTDTFDKMIKRMEKSIHESNQKFGKSNTVRMLGQAMGGELEPIAFQLAEEMEAGVEFEKQRDLVRKHLVSALRHALTDFNHLRQGMEEDNPYFLNTIKEIEKALKLAGETL